jgi:hypothetical protein
MARTAKELQHEIVESFYEDALPSDSLHLPRGIAGRIFESVVQRVLDDNGIAYSKEKSHPPLHIESSFHRVAASCGREVRTRTNWYVPDFTLSSGTWLEAAIREAEAHKKTFLYAHQCSRLVVVYLIGSPRVVYRNPFPNTQVMSVYEEPLGAILSQENQSHLTRLKLFITGDKGEV